VAPEPKTGYRNWENEALMTIHQILESWLCAATQLLARLNTRTETKDWEAAASDFWILELADGSKLLRLVHGPLADRHEALRRPSMEHRATTLSMENSQRR
jgi:hypothetical protein